MVKRVSWHSYIYLCFAFIVLLVSWEHNRTLAAVVEADIPEESIRLRILANSDSVEDQALKRHVRDAVVEQMNAWVTGPTSLEEARAMVRERLPVLEAVVGKEISRYGYDYSFRVELGKVSFPAKMYGNKLYPAGDYEALRVTIGEGKGQNWWCVLFPPLCFVEAAKGEAAKEAGQEQGKESGSRSGSGSEGKTWGQAAQSDKSDGGKGKASAKGLSGSAAQSKVQPEGDQSPLQGLDEAPVKPKLKVRFFLWEKVKGWFA